MMTCLLSYHDLPCEPLLSHSVRPTFFGIWMSSCFSFWGILVLFVGSIQLWTWMARITQLVMDDLVLSDFLTCHTSDAILGHIFVLVEICRSPLICMIIPIDEIYVKLMICFFILRWFPSGAFLESFSHTHTFWYCRDSMMELSQAHRLTYHHFSGVHVRSLIHPHWAILESLGQTGGTSCYTRAYFPSLAAEMICFLTDFLQSSLPGRGIFVCITSHCFDDFLTRWTFNGVLHSSFDCPIIYDPLVDCCVEVEVFALADYSLEIPHWIIYLRWRWIPPTEYFELKTFDLFWHFVRLTI